MDSVVLDKMASKTTGKVLRLKIEDLICRLKQCLSKKRNYMKIYINAKTEIGTQVTGEYPGME